MNPELGQDSSMETFNKMGGIVSKEATMKTQGVTDKQNAEDLDQGSGTKSGKEERRKGKMEQKTHQKEEGQERRRGAGRERRKRKNGSYRGKGEDIFH